MPLELSSVVSASKPQGGRGPDLAIGPYMPRPILNWPVSLFSCPVRNENGLLIYSTVDLLPKEQAAFVINNH